MRIYKIKTLASHLLVFADEEKRRLWYVNDSEDFARDNGKYISELERSDIDEIPAAAEYLDAEDYQTENRIATLSEAWELLKNEVIFDETNEILAGWNIDL
ncbi:MAG: hypothetical protein LUD47_04110 [Clostridia bacterium]|nr:hypothetical protein [Clostridia bacterium]